MKEIHSDTPKFIYHRISIYANRESQFWSLARKLKNLIDAGKDIPASELKIFLSYISTDYDDMDLPVPANIELAEEISKKIINWVEDKGYEFLEPAKTEIIIEDGKRIYELVAISHDTLIRNVVYNTYGSYILDKEKPDKEKCVLHVYGMIKDMNDEITRKKLSKRRMQLLAGIITAYLGLYRTEDEYEEVDTGRAYDVYLIESIRYYTEDKDRRDNNLIIK